LLERNNEVIKNSKKTSILELLCYTSHGCYEGGSKMTTKIADSGNRTEFGTGALRDMHTGKGRYDLLPWEAIHELAKHCEEGALKYGERNCEKGIPIHSLIDSAIRHLSCYLRGMKDEPHLRAAMWNIAFAIWMEKNKPEMQDIPSRLECVNGIDPRD
jgi:hypothetical protein